MPNISNFIREALAEDKYGYDFISHVDDRVRDMNAAQLRGLYDHMVLEARAAKTTMWRNANKKLMNDVEGLMILREAEVRKEEKRLQDIEDKAELKDRLRRIRAQEKVNALRNIEKQSRELAEREVREAEKKRLVTERTDIVFQTIKLEDKRDKFIVRCAVGYVVTALVVVIGVLEVGSILNVAALQQFGVYIILLVVVGGFLVTAYSLYKAYRKAQIFPKVVTEENLLEAIDELEAQIKEKSITEMKEKKEAFERAEAKEKVERKARKETEKQKKILEAKILAEAAEEQRSMAESIMGSKSKRSESINDGMDSTIASSIHVHDREQHEERKEEEDGDSLPHPPFPPLLLSSFPSFADCVVSPVNISILGVELSALALDQLQHGNNTFSSIGSTLFAQFEQHAAFDQEQEDGLSAIMSQRSPRVIVDAFWRSSTTRPEQFADSCFFLNVGEKGNEVIMSKLTDKIVLSIAVSVLFDDAGDEIAEGGSGGGEKKEEGGGKKAREEQQHHQQRVVFVGLAEISYEEVVQVAYEGNDDAALVDKISIQKLLFAKNKTVVGEVIVDLIRSRQLGNEEAPQEVVVEGEGGGGGGEDKEEDTSLRREAMEEK